MENYIVSTLHISPSQPKIWRSHKLIFIYPYLHKDNVTATKGEEEQL